MMKIIVFYSEKQNKVNDINLTLATAINGEYIVGRSRQSGIVLDSSDVSRQHGKFFLQNEDYYYSDLGSANGSLINNKLAKKNQSYLLKAGDVIRIGEFFLIMEAISEEAEALPATVLSSDWQSFAKVDTRKEVAAQTPEPASELPEVMAQAPQAVSEVPELVTSESEPLIQEMIDVQAPEEFEEVVVVEATTQQAAEELAEVPEQEAQSAQLISETTPEVATPAPEAVAVPEDVALPSEQEEQQEVEQDVLESSEQEEDEVEQDVLQSPEQEEQEEEVVVVEATTQQVAEELLQVPQEEAQSAQLTTETTPEVATPAPEAVAVPEDVALPSEQEEQQEVEQDVLQSPEQEEEEVEDVIQSPEQEEQEEEVLVTHTTTQQAPPEELAEVPEQEAQSAQLISETTPEVVISAPETVAVPEDVALPSEQEEQQEVEQDVLQSPEQEETESEVMAQPPQIASKAFEIISKKYIAFMAHDTKKSELVQFVNHYKDFLSKCLTIATPSISETLYQQTGLSVSQKTPLVPAGGYQAIASLVGSGEILAVVLLRDFMVTQSSQANEEALLRLCNINQVLVATNVSTAEAVMHYIKDMVTSL